MVIINDGVIQSYGDRAIDTTGAADGARSILLNNRGSIVGRDDGFRVNGDLPSGSVINVQNEGSIWAIGSSVDGIGNALNFGAIANASLISITNHEGGSIRSWTSDAILAGANTAINNAGLIQSEYAAGVNFRSSVGGSLINQEDGIISGATNGVERGTSGKVTNEGEIVGKAGSGLWFSTKVPDGSLLAEVINTGKISGTSGASEAGYGIYAAGQIDLSNEGLIEGVASFGGLGAAGIVAGGGLIHNHVGGEIRGDNLGIGISGFLGDEPSGQYAAVQIVNEGVIEGKSGTAIFVIGTFADVFVNKGTVKGSVGLGGGDDTVFLYTGSSISGALSGGEGSGDILNLSMDTDAEEWTGVISEISGFESLVVHGGSWTVYDEQAYTSGVTIHGMGELVLGFGAEIAADILNNGALVVERFGDYVLTNDITGDGVLTQRGPGTTVIAKANTFTGGATIENGALQLSAVGAVGTGTIRFWGEGGETLILDDAALTDNTLANEVIALGYGDAVNFTGLAFYAGTRVAYDETTGLVTVTGKGESYSFTLWGPEGASLIAVEDGSGGTNVIVQDVGVTIVGTKGKNLIDGQHTVLGQSLPTFADDTIHGRRGNDKMAGLDGNDVLRGNGGNDKLFGGEGNDWLYGGTGKNKLVGGEGYDAFVFDSMLGLGKAGSKQKSSFSIISDFEIGKDQIVLDSKVFTALAAGALSEDAFQIGNKAKTADAHILYKNGKLRYDADGKGGEKAVFFAKLSKKPDIDADDFLVI